jgi:hypothetical protein
MEKSYGGLPPLQGVGEGRHEIGMEDGRTGPADDLAAPKIEDGAPSPLRSIGYKSPRFLLESV